MSATSPLLIGELVRRNAETTPGATAAWMAGERLDFAQLNRLGNRIAWALQQQGLRRGDRLVCWAETCLDVLPLFVATSKMVHEALTAAEELAQDGIEAEVVDPRTLKPLDTETLTKSVAKTHRCVIVNEGCKTGGFASEVAATLGELVFDYLDAPVIRVAGMDTHIPFSPVLETTVVPTSDSIADGIRSIL